VAAVDRISLPEREGRQHTILIVEDEVLIRMTISEYLQDCGFKVLEASSALDAIAMIEASEFPIDVVFSDVRMPGMSGFELAQWVHDRKPGLPILLASGDAGLARNAQSLCEKHQVLAKPYDFSMALARIRALLDKQV
jgi:DNA-binding response OmpR family regulator